MTNQNTFTEQLHVCWDILLYKPQYIPVITPPIPKQDFTIEVINKKV